ncbi:unnamed protein product [Parnassius apollo]|uniref:(apollo) hypothetical protein n=1 Tax=Parnassius apollo TaxID=110799 RepID=A0A8S3WYK2_PARAO|nr:unnamed protein product [Parnassius apollo]
MSVKSSKSCVELAKQTKPTSRSVRGVSPSSAPTLRKKVLMQNAASSKKVSEDTDRMDRGMAEKVEATSESVTSNIIMGEPNEKTNIATMKTKGPETATDDNTSFDIEAELGLLGLCKPVHRTDDEWSDVESMEIHEISTKTSQDLSTCITGEQLRKEHTYNREELASIEKQVSGIMEKLNALGSDINVFKNNVADKESIEHIALALNSWKDPRIDDIANNMSNIKDTIRNLQTQVINLTSPQSTAMDSTSTAIEPVLCRLDKITEDIKEIRDYGVSQSDFNARSLWWGSRAEDERGLLLSEMIAELDMNVLNQGSDSTFYQYRGGKLHSSIVDVTCCTSAILHKMERWRVDPDFVTLSDHRAIQFQMIINIDKQNVVLRNSTRLFNTAKANWSLFRNDLKERLEKENVIEDKIKTIQTPEELDDIVDTYVKQVKLACQKSIPTISKNVYKTCTPWWNAQLETERRKVIRLRRKIKFANTRRKPHVIQDFVEAKEKYVNNIMSAITTSWKELCTKQEKETVWQSIYRIIKRCSVTNEDKLLKLGDEILTANESAMLLAKKFLPR